MKYIASVSWGKDSTAMLLLLLKYNIPLDEVVFFNTGVEFDEVYSVRDSFLPLLKNRNIKYTELYLKKNFFYYMLDHEFYSRKGVLKKGYGWCGGLCRWATGMKLNALNKYCKSFDYIYVGISKEEEHRKLRLENKKLCPLVDFGFMENDCLQLCYDNGFNWNGLYEHLDRLSCWCCANKNIKELTSLKRYYPKYFNKLVDLELKIGKPMKKRFWLSEREFDKDYHKQFKLF